ncbi:hypothetical protein MTR_7g092090 [Medicago truncatula]|uniref:Uncharacterized protein n=1 Tax=Medicago truncatula TaxID=3880 RepID=G7KTJ9_MEDTR|nr:hypothetical protein MTR_7g092090 [Medicago truncatula]
MTEKPAEYSFVGLLTVLCDEGICNEAANMSKLADDSKIFVIMMNIRSLKCMKDRQMLDVIWSKCMVCCKR